MGNILFITTQKLSEVKVVLEVPRENLVLEMFKIDGFHSQPELDQDTELIVSATDSELISQNSENP